METYTTKHSWFKNTKLIIDYENNKRSWEYNGKIVLAESSINNLDIDDLYNCFAFLSVNGRNDKRMANNLINTQVPPNLKIILDNGLEKIVYKTYEDIFNVIGSSYKNDLIKIYDINDENDENDENIIKMINGYPDSVFLTLKYNKDNNTLEYSYDR